CSRTPFSPSGWSSFSSGPAMYPSRDIVMSNTTFPMIPPLDPRQMAGSMVSPAPGGHILACALLPGEGKRGDAGARAAARAWGLDRCTRSHDEEIYIMTKKVDIDVWVADLRFPGWMDRWHQQAE